MINKGQISAEELKIQGLLDRFLKVRSASNISREEREHLDEDSLTAFIEGKISRIEAPVILGHLADCSFCLHVTGELAKLSDIFAEDKPAAVIPAKEPTRVSEVLSGILSRIFGTGDGAVFAHQEDEKEDKEDDNNNSKTS